MGANEKRNAAHGYAPAVVHLAIMYDALCHECGWESPGNPHPFERDAEESAESHRCKK